MTQSLRVLPSALLITGAITPATEARWKRELMKLEGYHRIYYNKAAQDLVRTTPVKLIPLPFLCLNPGKMPDMLSILHKNVAALKQLAGSSGQGARIVAHIEKHGLPYYGA